MRFIVRSCPGVVVGYEKKSRYIRAGPGISTTSNGGCDEWTGYGRPGPSQSGASDEQLDVGFCGVVEEGSCSRDVAAIDEVRLLHIHDTHGCGAGEEGHA